MNQTVTTRKRIATQAGRATSIAWKKTLMSDLVFLGRRVKPLALASAFATTAMLLGPFYGGTTGVFDFKSPPAIFLVVAALCTTVLFIIAWWRESTQLTQYAYLLTAGVFAARAMLGFLASGFSHPAPWISIAWAIAAGGAYIVERDGKQQDHS